MKNFNETELLRWIKRSVKTGSNTYSQGYQGKVYLYQDGGRRFIIKSPIGRGFGRFVRLMMLRNENRVYARLPAIPGVPRCYGFLDNRYLVLEYIDGTPFRTARITDRTLFFETLLNVIKDLHKVGIAHTDLKKKDNLLVVKGKIPYIIDFGVAVIRKPGLAPLNHYLYNIASRFDFNAWVKLKYDGEYERMSEKDGKYYKRTMVEKIARWIKDNVMRC